MADPQGVGQVLKNLVDNAIRYTPPGGKIRVLIQEEGDRVRTTVEDNGPGIPTPALTRIFERFYRVDPARSRAEGGTGLGLAIVRHLVHAMDGEVWAESEFGQGTRIIFTLPAAREIDLEEFDGDSSQMDVDDGARDELPPRPWGTPEGAS
jgi:signal transduction histidine kinase